MRVYKSATTAGWQMPLLFFLICTLFQQGFSRRIINALFASMEQSFQNLVGDIPHWMIPTPSESQVQLQGCVQS